MKQVLKTALNLEWRKRQEQVTVKSREAYNWALKNGIAKEQARAVLPEGNTEVYYTWQVHFEVGFTIVNYVEVMELKKNI